MLIASDDMILLWSSRGRWGFVLGVLAVVGVLFSNDIMASDGVLFLNDMITYVHIPTGLLRLLLLWGCDEFEKTRLKPRMAASWRGKLLGLQPWRGRLRLASPSDDASTLALLHIHNWPYFDLLQTTTVTFRRTCTGSGVGCTSTVACSSGEGSKGGYYEGEHLINIFLCSCYLIHEWAFRLNCKYFSIKRYKTGLKSTCWNPSHPFQETDEMARRKALLPGDSVSHPENSKNSRM
nr:hypothetical protein [Tanacetum cinerariifolium]